MTAPQMLDKLLNAYRTYYDVRRENVAPPFVAEASFRSHTEQYFLIRAARISEAESNEHVFFALEETLSVARLRELDAAAWNVGLSRVTPHKDHRNTDITLLIFADRVNSDASALIPKLKYYKSYRWGLQGWSHYRLAVADADAGRVFYNRQGRTLRELFRRNLGIS